MKLMKFYFFYMLRLSISIHFAMRKKVEITEKCTKITIDGVTYGFFDDGRAVNNSEKDNILKTTPLTYASV